MKKCSITVTALFLALSLFTPSSYGDEIYLSSECQPIKVYLKGFSNESGQPQISAEEFAKEVAKAFTNRKAVLFQVVKTPEESDIVVSGAIKRYQYLDRGPLTLTPGIGVMVVDAVATATENYVEMAVEFTIADAKDGSTLWKNTLHSYIKQTMTPDESIPLIYDKAARGFVARSFGKGK